MESHTLSSRTVRRWMPEWLIVPKGDGDEENAKKVRHLLAMARETHPEKVAGDVVEVVKDGIVHLAVSVGSSVTGMDHNVLVFGPTRYVEDMVD